MIYGNIVGTINGNIGKSFVVTDKNGNKAVAVMVEEETEFTATANDIREGVIAATDSGVTKGTKVIPSYYAHQGNVIIMPGKSFVYSDSDYNYKKLQGLICSFNTSLSNSVATEKVAINDNVYDVLSTNVVSTILKENGIIDFGLKNESTTPKILRYFYFTEVN